MANGYSESTTVNSSDSALSDSQESGATLKEAVAPMSLATRAYQQEMLDESLKGNIIIALDTGSGKTHIAVLRIKHEIERGSDKICWFVAPTVALCQQQQSVIKTYIPGPVGIISGSHQPDQWKNASLWKSVLDSHRIIVSTPQVFLDGLRHGYISLGRQIGLLVFDEAHHAVDNHPYNMIMKEFYFRLPARDATGSSEMGCRPVVLGLTASPIFGSGDVNKAFKAIEANLDASICTPRYHRAELAQYVHRPIFKHAPYTSSASTSFSTNLATISYTLSTLNIENDPYIISLRAQLKKASPTSDQHKRLDQKLSKALTKQDTFTHTGLRDFERAAKDICDDLGAWAADWYVYTVVQKAKHAANPYNNIMSNWKSQEKRYLLSILSSLVLSPPSYYEDDILEETSDKVRVLIQCLVEEKEDVEGRNEAFSGIVFVQRRDSVLALAELLSNHPVVKDTFNIGVLLGTSDSAYRHSLMDVTRQITKQSQDSTISQFKIGLKNLIISTSVAEEGIDIPACGTVIRWDPPPNMASWIQSRGRARRARSVFVLMYDVEEEKHQKNVSKWRDLEERMVDMYRDPARALPDDVVDTFGEEPDDWDVELGVESTGACLTPHSAVSHLSHFCAVISRSGNAENRPIYDTDPPDYIPNFHSLDPKPAVPIYTGPWTSTVTLPRSLPIPVRTFTTDRPYSTKLAAHRHAAFKAYKALWELGLLNENLLPFGSGGMGEDGEVEEEVRRMLMDVERREGLARVGVQVDPWEPADGASRDGSGEEEEEEVWYLHELVFESANGTPPLLFFARREIREEVGFEDGPKLWRPGREVVRVGLFHPASPSTMSSITTKIVRSDDPLIQKAREYTRMIFWCMNGSRMEWENMDFAYLFLPKEYMARGVWEKRRDLVQALRARDNQAFRSESAYSMDGGSFMQHFGCTEDITIVRKSLQYGRAYEFVRWQRERLGEEEEGLVKEAYRKRGLEEDEELVYPLLVVRPFPPRSNLLVEGDAPVESKGKKKEGDKDEEKPKELYFIPRLSGISLYSPYESEYIFLLPSLLRWFTLHLTSTSLRSSLFLSDSASDSDSMLSAPHPSPLASIPIPLLTNAMLAPAAGESKNYQRLETLGDGVLKFTAGLQLFAEYPVWHEGYLTRKKDHAVSNVRLAKEDVKRKLYRWIIRDRMLGRKWKPKYVNRSGTITVTPTASPPPGTVETDPTAAGSGSGVNGTIDIPMDNSPHLNGVSANTILNLNGASMDTSPDSDAKPVSAAGNVDESQKKDKKQKKKKKQSKDLSTKVLADVVESLIGAAYLHGGFNLGYECTKFFDLGLKFEPIPTRLAQILSRVQDETDLQVPPQIADVEHMFGYTFTRKILLIEALTHASYREHINTISYERMEFIGDSILDMIVTDYLFRAEGKEYSPGNMHIRKSAVVNGHFLAYVCLGLRREYDSVMPRVAGSWNQGEDESYRGHGHAGQQFVPGTSTHEIYFWQCLLHSSQQVLDDQRNTFTRYQTRKDEIQEAMDTSSIFPWSSLTRLQAPKFFSDIIESVIGAIFIDSNGNMDVISNTLRRIGILPTLERIVKDDVDVLHPVSRLAMWGSKNERKIEYKFEKERGDVACVILVDGVEEVRETERYRGMASQEEVKFAAAEKAIKMFRLRDVGSNPVTRKKAKPKSKKNKGKGKEKA